MRVLQRKATSKFQNVRLTVTDASQVFRKVVIAVVVYIIALSVWVLIYRASGLVLQTILPFILLFLVFGWKKVRSAVSIPNHILTDH